MRALVWIIEDTWQATVAEAAAFLPSDAEITLLHVASTEPETRRPRGAPRPAGPTPTCTRSPGAAARDLRAGRQRAARRSADAAGAPSHTPGPPRAGRTRGRGRRRGHGHPRPRPRRRPRAARTAQPRPRDALRHRPRPLPRTAHLARRHARADDDPPATSTRGPSASLAVRLSTPRRGPHRPARRRVAGRLLGGEMFVPETDQGPRDGHRLRFDRRTAAGLR